MSQPQGVPLDTPNFLLKSINGCKRYFGARQNPILSYNKIDFESAVSLVSSRKEFEEIGLTTSAVVLWCRRKAGTLAGTA